MINRGKTTMEKEMREDDLKGLEEEIDSAVDRLFVEKKGGLIESLLKESSHLEPSSETEKTLDTISEDFSDTDELNLETLGTSLSDQLLEEKESELTENLILEESPLEIPSEIEEKVDIKSPPLAPTMSVSISQSIEELETQLLSLEWETTEENFQRTKREVLALRHTLNDEPNISPVLDLMEKVLTRMMNNGEIIRPPLIKFLLDSKETIKLLMRKEADPQIEIYKRLAYQGIEARCSCLEGFQETQTKALQGLNSADDMGKTPAEGWKKIEEISNQMNLFSEKMEATLKKIDQVLLNHSRGDRNTEEKLDIWVFQVDGKLFGVENDKVFKLYKVPGMFYEKYSKQQRIRFKDFEVKMVDLKKVFSIQEEDRRREIRILIVKDGGEYKGLIIEQVLRRLSTYSESGKEPGGYFMGWIHWPYRENPVEVPILDLRKL